MDGQKRRGPRDLPAALPLRTGHRGKCPEPDPSQPQQPAHRVEGIREV